MPSPPHPIFHLSAELISHRSKRWICIHLGTQMHAEVRWLQVGLLGLSLCSPERYPSPSCLLGVRRFCCWGASARSVRIFPADLESGQSKDPVMGKGFARIAAAIYSGKISTASAGGNWSSHSCPTLGSVIALLLRLPLSQLIWDC